MKPPDLALLKEVLRTKPFHLLIKYTTYTHAYLVKCKCFLFMGVGSFGLLDEQKSSMRGRRVT